MTLLNPVTDWSVGQWEDRKIWQLGHRYGLKFRWRRQPCQEIGDGAVAGSMCTKLPYPSHSTKSYTMSQALFYV